MKRKYSLKFAASVVALLFSAATTSSAQAIELIANGDFETGLFAPWIVTDQPGGSGSEFLSAPGAPTPFSGHPTLPIGGLPHGAWTAVSDQTGPGTHALTQTFVVPGPAANVTLSFDMFVNDYDGGPTVDPSGLDYTSGGTFAPNEHGRVDILSAGAPALSTTVGLLSNLYIGADPLAGNPHPFTHYVFNITGVVGGGGPFDLRFAEVDNSGFFNQGVDNVSINFTPTPEPSSVILAAIGVLCTGWFGYRRRRSSKHFPTDQT
jgi:hypothetical protein